MSQDLELNSLREELKKIESQMRSSRRRAAVGFVILVLVVIMSVVYGFVQRVEAVRNAEEANRQRLLAVASQEQAMMNAAEAKKQEGLAMEQRRLAAEKIQELEKCCKKR